MAFALVPGRQRHASREVAIRNSGAAPIQTIVYSTSGSQSMHLGHTIGSLSLVDFVGTNGGHLVA